MAWLYRTIQQLDVCHIMAVTSHKTTLSAKLVVGLYDCSMSKLNNSHSMYTRTLRAILKTVLYCFLVASGCTNQLHTLVRLFLNIFQMCLFEKRSLCDVEENLVGDEQTCCQARAPLYFYVEKELKLLQFKQVLFFSFYFVFLGR